jgi:hypothetical protein
MSGLDPEGTAVGVPHLVPIGRGAESPTRKEGGDERGVSFQGISAVQRAFIRKSRGSRL